jgi:glucose-1-phosphate adenylyltransferase
MDYAKMLDFHKKSEADCTIAVIDVSLEEASRFGIMSADADGRIFKFTEKPKNPDSTLASMGIYIFTKSVLEKYLCADAEDPTSSNDFGKNIIPNMLGAGEKLMAYPFVGYWKDVGTIASLWETNMDLLGENPTLNLDDEDWRIYSRHEAHAPQYVGADARIENSSLTDGCEIFGTVINSVLGAGVKVMEGAVVRDSVILDDVVIESGAKIEYSIIDGNTVVGKNCSVGAPKEGAKEITVIGANINVPEGTDVKEGAMISKAADLNKEGK